MTRIRAAAPRGAGDEIEAIVEPLTALVARVEVIRDLVRRGEPGELTAHLAAVQDSAERLAERVRA